MRLSFWEKSEPQARSYRRRKRRKSLKMRQPARNATLSSSLPATFELNWNHCENGSAHPVPSDGCTSCMGYPVPSLAGKEVPIIMCAAEHIRNAGYSVEIIPGDYDEESSAESVPLESNDTGDGDEERSNKRVKREDKTLIEREEAYIRETNIHDGFKVFDSDRNIVATFKTIRSNEVWIIFTFFNDSVYDDLRGPCSLEGQFFLSKPFPHVLEELPMNVEEINLQDGSLRLEAVTGDEADSETKTTITTRFTMYFRYESTAKGTPNEKVVAKALCSYQNTESSRVGPNIEMFETAKEWRKHSLGDSLMRAIHDFYTRKFEQMTVWFSVCHVVNADALRWFTRRHNFRVLDGQGQELGKTLVGVTQDDDEEEDY